MKDSHTILVPYQPSWSDKFEVEKDKLQKLVNLNRIKAEGGKFEGSEDERVSYLQEAVELGAEYIDIEKDYVYNLGMDRDKTKLIVSSHNFEKTPNNLHLNLLYDEIVKKGADIVKIATKANNYEDSLRMLSFLLESSKNQKQEMIGICMGKEGIMTRVYGPMFGSYLTFACLSEEQASAPGQISITELKNIWNSLGIRIN